MSHRQKLPSSLAVQKKRSSGNATGSSKNTKRSSAPLDRFF